MTTVPNVRRHPRRRALMPIIRYTALSLFALPWIVLPFWMVLVNSFKTEGEANGLTMSWPTEWAAGENFSTVITAGHYFTGLRNSLFIAVPTIVAVLLLASMAAWSYGRSKSRTLKFTYLASILSIVLPPAIIPTTFVLQQLDLNGSALGYLLTVIGTRVGGVIFLATGFVRALPPDMEEAAEIDGASHWQVYRHIILPMLSPVLFVGTVIMIISVWNDFYFALFLLQDSASATLPLTLYQFASASTHGVRWNLVFTHVLLTSLPLIITYIVLQRRVLAGLAEGGVKG
ncbi:raffinose/stachyose/melibiose transport system permease protein [Kibdelosporangium banguiense]|uniref:Raffinose/stachyose/melibiose transport system permease protein n=1 Tax=Kibdelosporangium banguiense TaxID=1365924 RepID=A0ABS4TX69_9PSEU|nr:carbohydrate ABC transporter permease [Kibdelosporangium banguiense]MBP2328972.1 raffinose/stachyose/melibiose transport system permease protein [Kibdelosporangium banguiense]